jgi:hypothetical protein
MPRLTGTPTTRATKAEARVPASAVRIVVHVPGGAGQEPEEPEFPERRPAAVDHGSEDADEDQEHQEGAGGGGEPEGAVGRVEAGAGTPAWRAIPTLLMLRCEGEA